MVSSYARIRLNKQEAMDRFSRWVEFAPLGPPRPVASSQIVPSATQGGKWICKVAVWIFEGNGWTVFDDSTGYFGSVSAERWLEFAQGDELVFAAYNESIHCGQLIVVNAGKVVRDFLDDRQDPRDNKDLGTLPYEEVDPIKTWVDAASFVDDDKLARSSSDTALLWMFGRVD
jgi:hypothetical protein